ncbi:NAD(P)/FAD-dependent oxidoreductase [Myroides sp. LJL116]
MYDYIVVGSGLAGICFCEKLASEGKTFIVIDSQSRSSSLVAGGMYNPVVLKRFTQVWKVDEQLEIANSFYPSLENKLGIKFWHPLPLYRRLVDVEEQNNWFVASDKPSLEQYLQSDLSRENFPGISSPFGFGQVSSTGYLETSELIGAYRLYLQEKGVYKREVFDYEELTYDEHGVAYKGIQARNIVFAQGFGLSDNPYFNQLPLDGTKGELLIVKIPGLKIDFILKAGVFVIPLKDDLFKVGATYNWQDKTDNTTKEGLEELIAGLKEAVSLDFEVIEHKAGIRPTVKDRRPLLGRSLESDRIFVLNGLGTRGVLLGPFLANKLFNFIEKAEPLEEEVSIHRYKKFKIKKK